MRLGLYWNYATRSLMRSGQRTVLAIFCIAVGVMAIVALQLVGISFNQALTTNVVQANGGDINISTANTPLTQNDLAKVSALKQSGQITDYATAYRITSQITLPDGSIVSPDLVGVSSNFPLVGDADFIAPSSNLNTHTLLTGNNVTLDSGTYDALNAHIGDSFQVKTGDGRLVPITIAAEYKAGSGFGNGDIYIASATLGAIRDVAGKPVPAQYSNIYITAPSSNVNSVKTTLANELPTANVRSAPITSSVDFSSGPRMVSTPRIFAKEKTGIFTTTNGARGAKPVPYSMPCKVSPSAMRVAAATMLMPVAF